MLGREREVVQSRTENRYYCILQLVRRWGTGEEILGRQSHSSNLTWEYSSTDTALPFCCTAKNSVSGL